MKKSASLTLYLFCAALVFVPMAGCDESIELPGRTISGKTTFDWDGELTEGIPESSNWRYPYPDIIEREFIPPYSKFNHTKCLAWRITWPAYEASADDNKIPTVFATVNGALSSFNYLNSVDPVNTYKTDFSLFYDDKVAASAGMWAELDYADVSEMEVPYFVLSNQPLDNIIDWVTERPSLFESYWPGGGDNDLDYSEGELIQFWLSKADLFGGIRIVQMSPRIIEVYLAVPNI